MSQFEIANGVVQIVLLQPEFSPKGKRLNLPGIHGNRTVELGQWARNITLGQAAP